VIARRTDETKDGSIIHTGPMLRQIREKINIELNEISQVTKIQVRTLEAIENEDYDALPPAAYVRGFVKTYAKLLALDPNKVANEYMERYAESRKGPEKHHVHFRFSRKKRAFLIQQK